MADPAVTFLLENVTQIIKSYVSLIAEAKNELEQLKNDLSSLRAFLREAAKKPKKEEQLREWERQIREAVYDAEDTIDSCLTQDAAEKGKRRPRILGGAKRVSLAKQVKEVREQKVKPMFDKAKMDFANMQIADGSGTSVSQPSMRVKKDEKPVKYIVGLKDQEEIIINYLKEETKELDIISIIGMPGLGKTTLAWKIYESDDIRFQFPTRIWVKVSQEFNKREVFQNILKEFTSDDMSRMTDQELADKVREWLDNRRFLLVMDDIWTVEAWTAIQYALPQSNNMGKVLITSRERTVGAQANVARKPHPLRFLDPKESWKLLRLEVFKNLEDCPEDLKVIGKDIATQCDGLPLAIVVIGGILLDQLSATEEIIAIQNAWENVSKNVNAFLKDAKEDRINISDVVALSYNKLPLDLRDCFLYLGVFPEDYEIPAWTLTRLWVAEGFIQHKEGKSLEEAAEENLKDLINRNLVMVGKTNPMGEVKTCRVHDVIHEFCNSKAGISEQNLFQEIKKSKDGVFEPSVSDIPRYRRLCIHFHLPEFLSKCLSGKQNGPRVRSFLCFYKDTILLDPLYIKTIPETFNLLRVLDSKSIKFSEFPIKVTKLIHLRFITLSFDDLKDLPDAVTELWNLQTLVVDTTSRILEIKASIWKMIQLRHLKTKAAIKLLAVKGEGESCENLQTLSRLSPECCTEKTFDRAPNLKTLGIRGRLADLSDSKSLRKLDHLENLKLVNDLLYGSAAEDRLRGLPASNFFPPNIKRLTLSATHLDWSHMSTLGMIGTLQVLKLKNKAFTGKYWKVVDGGFGSLQFLLIADIDLGRWEASDNHFTNLKCLVLKNCQNLQQIPFGLAKSLQILDIVGVSKTAVESARKIEEEKKNTQGPKQPRWGGFKLKLGPGCQ